MESNLTKESQLSSHLATFLENQGASLVGFSRLEKSPIEGQASLTNVITIAVKLSDSVLKTITDRPTIMYFHHYRTANAKLDQLAFSCVSFLESHGFSAFPIGASQSMPQNKYFGVFQHKTGAVNSGLGFIGKSGLFISEKYGSKIRLVTVLTDCELAEQNSPMKSKCKDCLICQKACPAGAIAGVEYELGASRDTIFDAEKCSNHMKTYKDVGRGAVCGICIKVCPYNKLRQS